MQLQECWGFIDERTGKRVSVTTTPTRWQAERQLREWIERDRQGKRPDVHDVIPHIKIVQLW